MRFIAFILMLLSGAASAAPTGMHVGKDTKANPLIDDVACTASEAGRRFTLSAGEAAGFGVGILQFSFTYSAATAVALACHGSLDHQTTWAQLQDCSVSAGKCTSSDASWEKSVSADAYWIWRVDFLGSPEVRCVVSCTGGGASDKLTVHGRLSTL